MFSFASFSLVKNTVTTSHPPSTSSCDIKLYLENLVQVQGMSVHAGNLECDTLYENMNM